MVLEKSLTISDLDEGIDHDAVTLQLHGKGDARLGVLDQFQVSVYRLKTTFWINRGKSEIYLWLGPNFIIIKLSQVSLIIIISCIDLYCTHSME